MELAPNARAVLERRYLEKDEAGRVVETPEQLFRRVAHNIALAEERYGASRPQVAAVEGRFYDLMTSFRFLPNSPTLGNAGRPLQQLAACFVLPVGDSMEGIFDALKHTALIHKSGGGTGFSFSSLRPEGDRVLATGGIASGPVSFMRVFDAATEAIKQGGTRRGANMAILSVYHPDIETFINVKADMVTLQNFNISVAVDAAFLEAVERDRPYTLVNPRTGKPAGRRGASQVFRQIVENAWRNGDPGLVFLDRINRDNPTPQLGRIEATNPCGEQPLLPYESCNLGSLDLAKFVRQAKGKNPEPRTKNRGRLSRDGSRSSVLGSPKEVDWDALAAAIPDCIRFLDDVIDQNVYPIPQIEEATKRTRKIGLGVMGWADLLVALRIPYDSKEAVALAERMMAFVQEHADRASEALGRERGAFPAWEGSVYEPKADGASDRAKGRTARRFRNATRTTIAPTGTLSIIADCSGGIEPVFALAFLRQHHLDPKDPDRVTQLPEVNRAFEVVAKAEGFYSAELMEELARGGSIQGRRDVPAWVRRVFVTSHDIDPEWHVRMQAAFQRHTDNAVSKTINFRASATAEDVERAYLLAYREGCKGITIYRDQSRPLQVLSHAAVRGPEQAEAQAAEAALGLPTAAGPTAPGAGQRGVGPYRRRLPDERPSVTHKFRVADQEGYVTVGLFEDGRPGEVFITISKEGSTIRGLMDSVAVLTSLALQYGVPLEDLVRKFRGVHFEPAGFTDNPELPQASSLVDYIFRWLEQRFVQEGRGSRVAGGGSKTQGAKSRRSRRAAQAASTAEDIGTGLACPECGSVLVFAEGCLVCRSCGYTKCG
ncbi:MAG: ribonucleoside-diphosphate reductase, adenosylcobalamin-dependent [Chloroflexi bacterium RBG_16_68_14]|nr:MAG: ribonucleoside-diphosphate reductase, adenosylcobalamin-dependent [Chloroflexi bacterium RBG_16_68_14]